MKTKFTFKDLIERIAKRTGLGKIMIESAIADNLGKSWQTIYKWQNGKAIPNIYELHDLYLFLKERYQVDEDLLQIFKNTK
jgi:hypothetical protein